MLQGVAEGLEKRNSLFCSIIICQVGHEREGERAHVIGILSFSELSDSLQSHKYIYSMS